MDKKQRLAEILKNKSILRGSFTLASGKESDYYIDGRLTTLDSAGLKLIGEIFLDEISPSYFMPSYKNSCYYSLKVLSLML